MNLIRSSRRGAILLQTLVMCVLLALISVSITRWVLGRYMGATRTARSSIARGTVPGNAMWLFSQWNLNWPVNTQTDIPLDINNKHMTLSYLSSNGTAVRRVIYSYDEEQ